MSKQKIQTVGAGSIIPVMSIRRTINDLSVFGDRESCDFFQRIMDAKLNPENEEVHFKIDNLTQDIQYPTSEKVLACEISVVVILHHILSDSKDRLHEILNDHRPLLCSSSLDGKRTIVYSAAGDGARGKICFRSIEAENVLRTCYRPVLLLSAREMAA